MAPCRTLYLVRHGESAGNVDPALRQSDPPLTDRGRAQAARAATALAPLGLDAVYASPLRRARETAERIAAEAGKSVETVDGFGEVDMGALAAPATDEQRSERDAIFAAMLAGDPSRGFPGGEDFGAVIARVRRGLRALEAAPGARLVLVTHRVPLAAAAASGGRDVSAFVRAACANGSITTLQADAGEPWRLVTWADARHLA